ncbi:casein kinase II subunit alpha [Phanerochaete sordida]|uniref:Casein kinase II subunit alpha n=1 Tax=Phanerochaete sordida TaxID=48140 RepID=A0A9P3GPG3_9APHY|nr:casein kinase II subunit alpha [Phanerochaete sordida]
MARVYADVNARLGPGWYDYESLRIDWNVPDNYEIISRIGGGKYSEVFEGVDMSNEETVVIKVLKPVAKRKIRREIKILRNLAGGPNVVGLLDVVHDSPSRSNSLIMEYVQNVDWKELYPTFTEIEIKHYVFQLLSALDFVHSRGIMHRDVKPGNVMFDRAHRKLRLIDWGLAEFYHPETEYHIRVGSRYYKGPELLVEYKKYDYSLDLWSVGCMLASMIFRKEHFFRGRDNEDQLLRILKVLGTDSFERYLEKYGLFIRTDNPGLLESHPKVPWTRFMTTDNKPNITTEVIDLLDKLLRYDHTERLTAAEALSHAYFNIVRLGTATKSADRVSDSGFASM